MSRLIDAEDFSRVIKEYCKDCIDHNKHKMDMVDINADIQDFLENQPTAYDVDKVVEKIDKDINWYQFLKDNLKCNGTVITSDRGVITTKQAILQNVKEIVKAGGLGD